jgi:hypothetical protein
MNAAHYIFQQYKTSFVTGGLFAAVALLYFILALTIPGETFWSGDEGLRYLQVLNMEKNGLLARELPYPGQDIDPEGRYYPLTAPYVRQGSNGYAIQYSPALPLLAYPFYKLFGRGGICIPIIAFSLWWLWLTWQLARHMHSLSSLRPMVVMAFLSPLPIYSLLFWDHSAGGALATLALLKLAQSDNFTLRPYIYAGLALGVGVWFRTEILLLAAAAIIALIASRDHRWNAPVLVALGMLAGALPLLVFQWVFEGDPMGRHFTGHLAASQASMGESVSRPFWSLLHVRWHYINWTYFRFSPYWKENALLIAGLAALVIWPRLERVKKEHKDFCVFPWMLVLLYMAYCLSGIDYAKTATGLFAAFPLAALILMPGPVPWGDRWPLLRLIGLLYVGMLMVLTPTILGGLQWGPRYLLPVLPLICLAISERLGATQRKYDMPRRVLFGVVVFISSLLLLFCVRNISREVGGYNLLHNSIPKVISKGDVVVGGPRWLAAVQSDYYFDYRFCRVPGLESASSERNYEELIRFTDMLSRSGRKHFYYISPKALAPGFPLEKRVGYYRKPWRIYRVSCPVQSGR